VYIWMESGFLDMGIAPLYRREPRAENREPSGVSLEVGWPFSVRGGAHV
jgi:hypothetical protein